MKRKSLILTVAVLVVMFFCASANAESILDRAKKDSRVTVGGIGIVHFFDLGSDSEKPYILRFVMEFNKPLKKVEAFWHNKGANSDNRIIQDGIKSYIMDDAGYVYLITFNMKVLRNLPQGYKTPVDIYVGCNNPVSNYPNFRRATIRVNEDVSKSEYHNYFEATPLRIVAYNKLNVKKALA